MPSNQEDVEFVKRQTGFSLARPAPMTYHQLPYTEKELRARYGIKPTPDNYEQTITTHNSPAHRRTVIKIGGKYYIRTRRGTHVPPPSRLRA
jgi:hypothetical protein